MLNSQSHNKDMIKPIIFSIIYTFYLYIVIKFIVENNILISLNDITANNIWTKFTTDFFLVLLAPCILIVINKKNLEKFKLVFRHTYLQYTLIIFLTLSFILHGDFTIKGAYQLFYSLIIVGFGEEFVFRGYIYNHLSNHNRLLGILVSGFFFGIIHAILPGVLAGNSFGRIALSMLNEIGGGILMGYYFIYILEKSKSLYIPIFVHAIMNYGIVGVVIITMVGTPIYLYIIDKKR